MDFLNFIFKEDDSAVGLMKFREQKVICGYKKAVELKLKKPIFKPNYSNNFFLF